MVVLTDTDLIYYLGALVALCEIVKNELEVIYVSLLETCLFNTIGVLIEAPCQH